MIEYFILLGIIILIILSIIAIKGYRKDKEEKTKLEKNLHILN